MLLPIFFCPSIEAADELGYSGRLVNAQGAPVQGPINLRAELVYSGDTSTILCSDDLSSVPLTKGVFHVKLNLNCGGSIPLNQILTDVPAGQSVTIRIVDTTNNKAYPFQNLNSIPSSLVSQTSKQLFQMGATDGQVLKWNNSAKKWEPGNVSSGTGGTVTTVTAHLPLSVASGSSAPDLTIAKATSSVNGYLAATDFTIFNNKENAITAGTSVQYYRGDKTWSNFITDVINSTLGTVTGNNTAIAMSDSIQTAFNKTQGQINALKSDSVSKLGLDQTVTGTVRFTDPTSYVLVRDPTGTSVNEVVNVQYLNSVIAGNGVWAKGGSNAINYVAGNVGIGTTSPQKHLHIAASSPGTLTLLGLESTDPTDGNGSVISFRAPTTGTGASTFVEYTAIQGKIETHNHATRSSSLGFYTSVNGAINESLRISADGKVGIGVSTPSYGLQVAPSTDQVAWFSRPATTDNPTVALSNGSGILTQFVAGGASAYMTGTAIGDAGLMISASKKFHVGVQNTMPALTATAGGNVGIGSTNPLTRFEVHSANPTGGNIAQIYNSANYTGTGDTGTFFEYHKAGLAIWKTGLVPDTDAWAIYGYGAGAYPERLRINSTGNVGIGTTNPTEKLEVVGKIKATEVCIGSDCKSSWPSGVSSGSIGNNEIADNSITYAKLNLSSGDIPLAKLAGSVDGTKYLRGDKTWGTFITDVIASTLGTITGSDTAIATGDSIQTAFNKTQGQISALKGDYISKTATSQTVSGTFSFTSPVAFLYSNTPTGTSTKEVANVEFVRNEIDTHGVWAKGASSTINYTGGNVGIGTSSPVTKLDVNGDGQPQALSLRGGSADHAYIGIYANAAAQTTRTAYFGFPAVGSKNFTLGNEFDDAGQFHFITKTSGGMNTRMVIDNTGHVGIGTTTPSSTLHVVGNNTLTGLFESGAGNHFRIHASGDGYGGGAAPLVLTGDPVASGAWKFLRGIADYNGTPVETFSVDGAGSGYFADSVGIGVTSPTSKLHVDGDIRNNSTSQKVYTNNIAIISSAADMDINYSSAKLNLHSDTTNSMTLLRNGSVGIGTTTPNAKLDVISSDTLISNGQGPAMYFRNTQSVDSDYLGIGWLGENNWGIMSADANTHRNLSLQPFGGNVGIGVSNPTEKLEVNGNIKFNGSLGMGSFGRIWNPAQAIGSTSYSGLYGMASTYNVYYNSGWKSIGGGTASALTIDEGRFSYSNSQQVVSPDSPLTWTTRLMVNDDGNVGIGTTTPDRYSHGGNNRVLEIHNPNTLMHSQSHLILSTASTLASSGIGSLTGVIATSSNGNKMVNYVGLGAGPNSTAANPTGSITFASRGPADNAPIGRVFISENGNFGVGTSAPSELLEVAGNVKATSYLHSSDRRLKKNVETIDSALEKILRLRGVEFDWKKSNEHEIGLIAQEVEEVEPNLVVTGGNGLKSVKYSNIVALLIEAMKNEHQELNEHESRISLLEKRVKSAEAENQELKLRLNRLEKLLLKK